MTKRQETGMAWITVFTLILLIIISVLVMK